MSKKNKRKTKLMVEVFTGGLPIFLIAFGLVSVLLYNGMMESYAKAKQDMMLKEIDQVCRSISLDDDTSWQLDIVETEDPELMQSPTTRYEDIAYIQFLYTMDRIDTSFNGLYDRNWVSQFTGDVRNYAVKEIYLSLSLSFQQIYEENDYSIVFLMDATEENMGKMIFDYCDDHSGLALDHEITFKIDEHPALRSAIENNSTDVIFERTEDFPHEGVYYVAYKPILEDGKVRAVMGIGYNWFDFLYDVLTFLFGLTLILYLGLLAVFVVHYLLLYFRAIRPVDIMQKSVRDYTVSKDGDSLVSKMDSIQSTNEIGQLSEDISDMAREIGKYTNDIVFMTKEKERVLTELEMAKSIQEGQLPSVFPAFPERDDFDIYASMTPAKAVGGDFYDFFLIDDDHLALVMADVSGKGVPAALFMMMTKMLLHNNAMLGLTPGEVLSRTNESICEYNPQQMFVTVWFGILELSTGKLTVANAGHEFPAISHAGSQFELHKVKPSFVLGGMEGMIYKEHEITLQKGSTLFLYTDGVPEATNGSEELYGSERMLSILNQNLDAVPQELLTAVKNDVDTFVGEAPQFDDLTMLAVKLM